jgi:hypothetical protein
VVWVGAVVAAAAAVVVLAAAAAVVVVVVVVVPTPTDSELNASGSGLTAITSPLTSLGEILLVEPLRPLLRHAQHAGTARPWRDWSALMPDAG